MGGVANDVTRGLTDIGTFGTAEIANAATGGGLYGNGGVLAPFGSNGWLGGLGGGGKNPDISGPFGLNMAQLQGDQSAITGLGSQQQGAIGSLGQQQFGANAGLAGQQFGQANQLAQQQYDQTLNQIPTTVSNLLAQENPQIMETLNTNKVLNSTAYPQELARQQSYLTQNLAIPAIERLQGAQTAAQTGLFGGQTAAQQGLNQAQAQALATGQGFQTGGLQRGLSMEDMINQANISKTIGQVFAPQPPTGKQNFGTTAQGIGALAPWAQVGKGGAKAAPSVASALPTITSASAGLAA